MAWQHWVSLVNAQVLSLWKCCKRGPAHCLLGDFSGVCPEHPSWSCHASSQKGLFVILEFSCTRYNLGYSRPMPCMAHDAQCWKGKRPLIPHFHWGPVARKHMATRSKSILSQSEKMQLLLGLSVSHNESLCLFLIPPLNTNLHSFSCPQEEMAGLGMLWVWAEENCFNSCVN